MPNAAKNSSLHRLNMSSAVLILSLVLILLFLASLAFGPVDIDILSWLGFKQGEARTDAGVIITQIRLPRALAATLIGGLLAVSGTATQGLFRNPLADPSLIGVTAGASVGASLSIVCSLWFDLPYLLFGTAIGAFIGSVVAVVVVYRLASNRFGTSVATMLLAGIGVTALAGGLTSSLEYVADNQMLRRMSLWRMGSLDGVSLQQVGLLALIVVGMVFWLPRQAVALNALLLGESEARHLGIDTEWVKRSLIIAVAAAVGVSVAMAGVIAFVGLVVPHIMRLLFGPDHRVLFPLTALAGAILLLTADLLARTLIAPTEFPVGLLTAILGAPFFLMLLRQKRGGWL